MSDGRKLDQGTFTVFECRPPVAGPGRACAITTVGSWLGSGETSFSEIFVVIRVPQPSLRGRAIELRRKGMTPAEAEQELDGMATSRILSELDVYLEKWCSAGAGRHYPGPYHLVRIDDPQSRKLWFYDAIGVPDLQTIKTTTKCRALTDYVDRVVDLGDMIVSR
jgi:hypothetical protein